MKTLLIALRVTAFTLLLTGVAYPLVMTGASQLLFPAKANGSLVRDDKNHVVGSELIAQAFVGAGYFQPRPSAAGNGYDAMSSGGSNLGPTSQKLKERVQADVARLERDNTAAGAIVPAELVTTSASGLDPHLSPEAALWQVPRIAQARGVDVERVRKVVEQSVEGRDLGFMGEPRVNVLMMNLVLDKLLGRPAPPAVEVIVPDAGQAEGAP